MSDRRKPYPFERIEPKWQARWDERRLFHAPSPGEPGFDPSRPKYYVLDMFPYPSGAGLHVGHPEGYTATDIVARYKRLRGFSVLHPMGWDAFGLPAEQYAIRTGQHPEITTRENIASFKRQLKRIGFSYDWEREINTTDPAYFRWTQWIFLQIYNSWFNPETRRAEPIATYTGDDPDSVRLAYVAEVPVNWCPELGTVLANEEVIDGKSEVGGFPVVRRPMRQWMLRITAFAERLMDELEPLDWPDGIKLLQRNWIGKSEGAEIEFEIDGSEHKVRVFTTRPDTLYGGTYLVLAPEHPLVDLIVSQGQQSTVREYREQAARKSDLERAELTKEKTGVFSGAFAINPASREKIPIWIADYVLSGYGTGAIGGVPAHDERDLEFARKFDLPLRVVVRPRDDTDPIGFFGEGIAVNSPLIDGLPSAEAKEKMTAWLEERGQGKRAINYKLRDWLFSRQRYWGEPFPIVWRDGKHEAIPESELPLVPPPLDDFKPTGTGEPPLARATDWVRYSDRRDARAEHHAAMGRLLLVLPALLRSAKRQAFRCRGGRAFLDERRPLRWRHGARRSASSLRPLLAQGPLRSRASFDERAIPAPGEPGNHPRRRRPQNVEALGQRDRSPRRHRRLRRGCLSLLRDVHGPARADETLEHDRGGRRLAFSGPRLATRHGRKPGRRMGPRTGGGGGGADPRAMEGSARHDQKSDRGHRGALFQYRDRPDDDFRERLHYRKVGAGGGVAEAARPA